MRALIILLMTYWFIQPALSQEQSAQETPAQEKPKICSREPAPYTIDAVVTLVFKQRQAECFRADPGFIERMALQYSMNSGNARLFSKTEFDALKNSIDKANASNAANHNGGAMQAAYAQLAQRAQAALLALGDKQSDHTVGVAGNSAWNPVVDVNEHWILPPIAEQPPLSFRKAVVDDCPAQPSTDDTIIARCKLAYAQLIELVEFTLTGKTIANIVSDDFLDPVAKDFAMLDARWAVFRDHSKPMYWWELVATSHCIGAEAYQGVDNLSPPSSQIILLHPALGYEYVADSTDGDKLKPAVFLELFGYNRWQWQGAKMQYPWFFSGASVLVGYSDRAHQSDNFYGLMVHAQSEYSIAVTRRASGEFGVMLNLDLEKFVTNKKAWFDELF